MPLDKDSPAKPPRFGEFKLAGQEVFDHPEVLEEGMVFTLETYWPAKNGWSAARIEEEVVVTATGCEVIIKFPAEELLVAGKRYYAVGGPTTTLRESQSYLNQPGAEGKLL